MGQDQDSLLREHEALSSEEETLHGVLDLRSLQQHNSREIQQLQQVRQKQDSIHEEHRQLFSGKDRQQLQQQHERHPQHQQQLQQVQQQHLSLGEETPNEGHHLLHPQHALHSQHQQQLETQRQQQLKQLNQQEENVDRFSSLQEEEDALHSEFHQNLAEAFKLLG